PKSKEAVQQVLRAAPGHLPSQMLAGAVEYALGNYAQSEQYLKAVLDKASSNLYARKLLTATLLRSGQTSRAVEVLQPALRQAPEEPTVLALAGEVYMQNKEFAKATQFFERAARIDPKNAQMRTGLGLSRLAAGEAERAMADLEAATDLDATHYQADVMLIMTHLARNEYDEADKAIQALEKKQPNNPLTHNLKGASLIGKKKFAEARKPFEKALQLSPGYFPAAMNLAQLDVRDKDPQAARKRFQAILAQDPNNLQALMALVALGSQINASTEEILGWLERAKKGNPSSPHPALLLSRYYLSAGDAKKAVELAVEARNISAENPEVLEALGLAQLYGGEKNAAVATFSKMVSVQPRAPMPLVRLASAQYASGNSSGAAASLKKALQLKPDLLEAQTAMVAIETQAGHYGEAMRIAKQVQTDSPKVGLGYLLEGDVHFAEKKYAPAAAAYGKAYAIAPTGPLAVKWYAALAQSGKAEEGEAKLTGWLKEHPDDVTVRLYMADINLRQQKHKAAIEQYEAIIKQQPQNAMVLNNLAWTYQQMKDPRALQVAERAYKADQKSTPILDTYGWMLVEQGQIEKGLGLLQQAVSAAPDRQEILFHYASALHRAGKKEQARIELERLLASGVKFPQEAEATALLAQIKK
ncbi:MAG: PEP-CTERM system TPR-repeat protein PrsT, partial [Burkholderiales bacterium]|nr:PEP-CTERM system TPR-repeat protein PrsT [Burkholderiales bacterium]